jgi:transposase
VICKVICRYFRKFYIKDFRHVYNYVEQQKVEQNPALQMVKQYAQEYLSMEFNTEPTQSMVNSFLSLVDTKSNFSALEQEYELMKIDIIDLMKKFSIRRLNNLLNNNEMAQLLMNFIQKPEAREQILDTIKVKTNEDELKQAYCSLIDEIIQFCRRRITNESTGITTHLL